MSSSEKLPLFDTDKSPSRSSIEIVSELKFPPYYEDGHVRYYAVKFWERFAWCASVAIVFHFDKSQQIYGPYIASGLVQWIILILRAVCIDIPLALTLGCIISLRPRSFCQMFYQAYHIWLPKTVDDYMVRFILGKNLKAHTQQQQPTN